MENTVPRDEEEATSACLQFTQQISEELWPAWVEARSADEWTGILDAWRRSWGSSLLKRRDICDPRFPTAWYTWPTRAKNRVGRYRTKYFVHFSISRNFLTTLTSDDPLIRVKESNYLRSPNEWNWVRDLSYGAKSLYREVIFCPE